MAQGAIDNDFDHAERSPEEAMDAAVADLDTDLSDGSIAIDLVTRQSLYIRRQVAETLIEYTEREDFDLNSYKSHPYLPVWKSDRVFECVFIARDTQQAHTAGKCYDYPEGRLMKVPVAEAWEDDDE